MRSSFEALLSDGLDNAQLSLGLREIWMVPGNRLERRAGS